MKALQVVTAVIILMFAGIFLTPPAFAQQTAKADSAVVTHQVKTDELFDRFEKGLVFGLASDIKGIVESSIYNAVNYKIAYPDFDSEQVEKELIRVSVEGDNHSLRFKAYLALTYYQNQNQFDSPDALLSLLDYSYQNGIFFYLQEKVQTAQFSSNLK